MHTSSIGPLDGNLVLRALEHSATQLHPAAGMLHREYGSTSYPTYITCPGSTSCASSRKLALPRIDRLRVTSNARRAALSVNFSCEKLNLEKRRATSRIYKQYQQYLGITRLDADKESLAGLFSSVNSDADMNRARCRRTVKLFAMQRTW